MKRYDAGDIAVLTAPIADGPGPRRERESRAVRGMLEEYFGCPVTVGHRESGAPYLEGRREHVSISHSAVQAVVAVSAHDGFGVDTETLRPQLERVKDKFLSAVDLPQCVTLRDLCRAWCAKEAVYKAAMTPGLSLADGIRIDGERAEAAGKLYRLITVESSDDAVTVLAVRDTPVGRFAPSPSGRMHLGNIFAALRSWKSVKERGGKWILRIEDLDPQRSRIEHSRMIEDDLNWLGIDWDEGGLDDRGPNGPYMQSRRHDIYEEYLARIKDTGMTYPCSCTRAEIMATQAPHQSDGRVIYGGRCRPAVMPSHAAEPATPHATRLYVPSREIVFYDRNYGLQRSDLAADCGDFILRRADGAWAYQLAVVVDDALMGVTEVVRGEDLLLSSAQQIYLYELLGFAPPLWAHVPLVRSEDGRRLSKRDRSMSMEELRRRYTPSEVIEMALAAGGKDQ